MCPTEAILKTKIGGTIKEPQWYGLGTPAPKSYHSVLFLTNHNFLTPKCINLMLWHNQDNYVTYVCAKQQLATMPILKIVSFIP